MKKTKEQPTNQEIINVLSTAEEALAAATELLERSMIRELRVRIDMKRQNLISYILGILVGMAIGSMIISYLAR